MPFVELFFSSSLSCLNPNVLATGTKCLACTPSAKYNSMALRSSASQENSKVYHQWFHWAASHSNTVSQLGRALHPSKPQVSTPSVTVHIYHQTNLWPPHCKYSSYSHYAKWEYRPNIYQNSYNICFICFCEIYARWAYMEDEFAYMCHIRSH